MFLAPVLSNSYWWASPPGGWPGIIQGTGFGLVVDLLIGIVGAFIGGWLLPLLGIHLGAGLVRSVRERAYCFP